MGGSETLALMAISGANMVMESQKQKKIQKQNREYHDQQAQALKRQNEANARAEEKRLKAARASHRARMAASGIAPDDGSSGAVLEGLKSSAQEKNEEQNVSYTSALSQLDRRAEAQVDKSIVPTTNTVKDHLGGTNSILSALQGWN